MTIGRAAKKATKAASSAVKSRAAGHGKASKLSAKRSRGSRRNQTDATNGNDAGTPQLSATVQLGPNTIRVRMYRIGFGDCFLLSLPIAKGTVSEDTHSHILVDCGVHAKGDIGTKEQIVSDIAAVTGKKLAVIIATHAHQDHIAGYDKFGEQFSAFEIGEVWLPWTWDPDNKKAVKLQKKHAALTDQLAHHFAALGAKSTKKADDKASNAVQNLKGNAHAIALLKSGFGVTSKVRYLKAGDVLSSSASKNDTDRIDIPGLSVRLLGPPESEEFLAQMDPPAGQHYLRLGPDGQAEVANAIQPFAQRWRLDHKSEEYRHIRLPSTDEKQLQNLASSPLDELAFALDQARNNESLVTLFVFRGRYLLFPGDAQYGNWRWWLENEQPDNILPRINFFKVAHHGSLNATPKGALEKMSDGKFAAMVSTQSTPWASIPRVPLMERLNEKTKSKIVRSDWLKIKGAPVPLPKAAPPLPEQLPEGFSQGAFWFDYLMDV